MRINIIETGSDYSERIKTLYGGASSLEEAIEATTDAGYRVMGNDDGGCCELGDDAYNVTVYPETRKLSEMSTGDDGYLPTGEHVILRDGGKMGGCEHDLYLALWHEDGNSVPVVIIDREDVSI